MAACQTMSCLHAVDARVGPMLLGQAHSFLDYIQQHVVEGYPSDGLVARRLVTILGYILRYSVDTLEQHSSSTGQVSLFWLALEPVYCSSF